MVRSRSSALSGGSASSLCRLGRGEILGLLTRGPAERGYTLYQEHKVARLTWTGEDLEGELKNPPSSVRVVERSGASPFASSCSQCGERPDLCAHAAATLLQWFDVRPTMMRLGPGSIWRSHSRHPFIAPARSTTDRVDLSHLSDSDLRPALELQLSLQRSGTALARLNGQEVEIRITLPSGDSRVVFFSASALPDALPLLHSLPRLRLNGELAELELSEARLHPVLRASWNDEGITLDPGYRLADGTVYSAEDLRDRLYGRWARIGGHLCRRLDPATLLVAFHRRGRQVLTGRDALRFLNLDHPQLVQHPWYLPEGQLASFRQPQEPRPTTLEAELTAKGKVLLRPGFAAGDRSLSWSEAVGLLETGFSRVGAVIVRAPDLQPFERAGFRMPQRGAEQGLIGDRVAFVRLVAETQLPVIGGEESLRTLADLLRGATTPAIADPPGLRSQLRPYQRDGVAWLWSRYLAGVGALLADDMGLGKTHQVMGLLCLLRQAQPLNRFLVVCPRGVLEHWLDLLARYAPNLETRTFHGPDRSLGELPPSTSVVVTTYDILVRSTAELTSHSWEVAVFDEAQRIKNPRTKAARASRKIQAGFRVAMSGTPLENRLLELWSVVDLIFPGYLGSEREFRSTHRNPSHHELHRLRKRLSVLTLRRLKEQVLSELPDKVEDLRFCHLTPEQESLYRDIHRERAAQIAEQLRDPGADIPYLHIFALLTRLKQVCDHPALITESASDESAGKIEVFDQILDEALAGDHRVVVFSQYVMMVELLERHLRERGIAVLILTGATRDRGRIVRRFNSAQHERVLLASLLAGGVGIDLTGASVVIHYDRWWNPAKENQATDRVHRIGQKRFVQVFKLLTRNTIEEHIDRIIESKTSLAAEVIAASDEVVQTFSRSEIADLLGLQLGDG